MLQILKDEIPKNVGGKKSFSCQVTIWNGKYDWQRPAQDYLASDLAMAVYTAVNSQISEFRKVHQEKIERLIVKICVGKTL